MSPVFMNHVSDCDVKNKFASSEFILIIFDELIPDNTLRHGSMFACPSSGYCLSVRDIAMTKFC